MTMAEIDALRLSETEVTRLRVLRAWWAERTWQLSPTLFEELEALERRRLEVEEALRAWWAQGCREVAHGP